MVKNNNKGQIALFLSIVFIGVLFFSGILVDGARIISGKANVTRAVEDACVSALALYNSKLKNDYGIFALSENDSDALSKTVETYITENLNIAINMEKNKTPDKTQRYLLDLYDFKIENLNVTPILNLTNNSIVKQQILEYMKYRAPKELGENIVEKFKMIKDLGEMVQLYEKKTEVERKLEDVDNIQKMLKRNISGTIGDGFFQIDYVQKFNLDGLRDIAINKYTDLISMQSSLIANIEQQRENLRYLEDAISFLGPEEKNEPETKKDKRKKLIKSLIEAQSDYRYNIDQLSDVKSNIENTFQQLSSTYTKNLIHANESAISNIKNLMKSSEKIDSSLNEIIEIANTSFNNFNNNDDYENSIATEFKQVCIDDLNNLRKLTPNLETGESMINTMENNIEALKSSLDALNEIHQKVKMETISGDAVFEVKERLSRVNKQYKAIKFDYPLPERVEKKEDPRKNIGIKVKETLKNLIALGLNIEQKDINFHELPSRKKIADEYIDDSGYDGNLGAIGNEMDLTKTKGTFTKKALNFISNIGKAIGNNMIDKRDDIYISQFIMDKFKSKVDKAIIDNEDENNNGGNFQQDNNKMKEEKYKNCFQAEIEYILHGSEWEEINVTKTMSQIALIRFGINTFEMYMNIEKRQEAYSIAAAIAGWWTGGAGIPIIANLVLCSWGIKEGLKDLNTLMKGEAIPIFKKTNIKFSYNDYLMLLLMQKNSDVKIDRIQDLIELNIRKSRDSFKMGNSNSAIRVEAEVSMKYLFVIQPFMPARLKTSDGRHKIKVLIYDGY